MKNIVGCFILSLLIGSLSCTKIVQVPPPSLPEATHSGKNTFGFYLNNVLWLPKSKGVESGIQSLTSTFYASNLSLAAIELNQHLSIVVSNVVDTGRYDLTAIGNSCRFTDGTTSYTCTSGLIDITYLDQQNFIVSGAFALKAKSDQGIEISITQGRFDTKY